MLEIVYCFFTEILIHSLSAPDITKNDGVYSQYILPLTQNGIYSSFCRFLGEDSIGSRIFPLPSFHVIHPASPFQDILPPSQITDLQVFDTKPQNLYDSAKLKFTWTAPGDDLNQGKFKNHHYFVWTFLIAFFVPFGSFGCF